MIQDLGSWASIFEPLLARVSRGKIPAGGFAVELFDLSKDFLYLACSDSGDLALLVTSSQSNVLPAPLRLAALSADFGISCILNDGLKEQSLRVSVLRCISTERTTNQLFATMCGALAESMRVLPTEKEFSELINGWSGLFWRLGQNVATDLVGLAGELTVLYQATDADLWVRAWHGDPSELLDFKFPESSVSVEVKAKRGSNREHPISLGQVSDPGLDTRYLASVQVEFNDSGEPLSELVRQINDRLSLDSSRMMFWGVLAATCGQNLEETLSVRYDVERAAKSIAFYRAAEVPVPNVKIPLPSGVTSLKFTSNFALTAEVTAAEVALAASTRLSP